ncbi:Protein of unknown function [Gryllus bimaculatus]|nr:Protein of unknown function [Gryllus bimaculatus]
MGEARKL